MELHGCRECLWMLSRMPMDVVEVAMHEVGMRGVAMLHDCFYTCRGRRNGGCRIACIVFDAGVRLFCGLTPYSNAAVGKLG